MYDQESRSWWSQLFGEAVQGPLVGKKLEKLPSTLTTWGKWKARFPDTTVYVKPETTYRARFTRESVTKLAGRTGPVENDDLVVGIEGHVQAKAYLLRHLAQNRLLNDTLEDHPVAIFLSEDLATASVVNRTVEDRALTLALTPGDQLTDSETGSVWDPLTGEALDGPMKGQRLRKLTSTYSLWFAWKKYRPDTVLVSGE